MTHEPPLKIAEAAAYLKVGQATVYSLCSAGRLPHTRIGLGRGTIRIKKEALNALLREGEQKAEAPRFTVAMLQAL
jgi:excisionase family DNA binding protein